MKAARGRQAVGQRRVRTVGPEASLQPEPQPGSAPTCRCQNSHLHHRGEPSEGCGRKAVIPDKDSICHYSPHLPFQPDSGHLYLRVRQIEQDPQSPEKQGCLGVSITRTGQMGCGRSKQRPAARTGKCSPGRCYQRVSWVGLCAHQKRPTQYYLIGMGSSKNR